MVNKFNLTARVTFTLVPVQGIKFSEAFYDRAKSIISEVLKDVSGIANAEIQVSPERVVIALDIDGKFDYDKLYSIIGTKLEVLNNFGLT